MSWEEEKKKVQVWKPISFKGDGRGRKTLNFMTGKERQQELKALKRLIYKKYTTALRMDIRYVRIVVYLFQNYVKH